MNKLTHFRLALSLIILCGLAEMSERESRAQPKTKPGNPPSSLGDLAKKAEQRPAPRMLDPLRFSPPVVDEAKCQMRGIRKLESEHLTLYTDLPSQPAVDELPHIFDLAVPHWAEWFEIPAERVKKWRMVATLARNKEKFYGTGLWPENLPPFLNGFMREGQFWCYEQPSVYYRRHLLLHEGTHGFMYAVCGNLGPPWYAEGVAELLGTHRWDGKELKLGVVPRNREETPLWGRIKLIKDDVARGGALSLVDVMNYSSQAHLKNEPYAWSWLAAAYFDSDPDLRPAFRAMRYSTAESSATFATEFFNTLDRTANQLQLDWQWLAANIEYGYDFPREKIVPHEDRPLPAGETEIVVQADRGWQSTGYTLAAGSKYQLSASGRFQIAKTSKPWISEPDGVTIHYHRRQPLGRLLAAIVPGRDAKELIHPQAIGSQGTITVETAGVLYLRLNDSPAELADNVGEVVVKLKPANK